jgi:hypothetical protein
MSIVGAKAENICSQRVFRLLTEAGHRLYRAIRLTRLTLGYAET